MLRLDRKKTFRPKKKFDKGSLRYDLYKKAKASLGTGESLKVAVQLPPTENLNEWLAVHVVDFFNRVNLIYGTIGDQCDCPTMSAGRQYEYSWADGKDYKTPTSLPAAQYVALLMEWIEQQINDEAIFPSKIDTPFPKTFQQVCKNIFKRLFRVFAHVYYHHFETVQAIGAEAHVNTCFKHFYYFVKEFSLIEPKELEPLKQLADSIC
ncbi:hypothetical protein CAOG_00376 [Capsaspora owczarzaki ATCC 30864]|uniref:Uncharacterized protein n=1 Tax=Capsaspora owczarzaki (strain ATCC 30864) TaxID=595528 RepID=A0A0D2WIF2_CAPO3|nr:hypothetical protein CAOG_00376 [Capsaspora owczarzaki ATCC 30864]KJE88793.1 hypothetical protein CAOG_000376 [Capsaspora owczarzaki ATCC 30864]|eukprot:XP_004365247.1 hypothetical protein CAOG_00376 [Capsaspora owczarzaki ATCC 30864]